MVRFDRIYLLSTIALFLAFDTTSVWIFNSSAIRSIPSSLPVCVITKKSISSETANLFNIPYVVVSAARSI
jgi:hypothetical protein